MPWHLVLQFQVLHFHAVTFGPSFSGPAFSGTVFSAPPLSEARRAPCGQCLHISPSIASLSRNYHRQVIQAPVPVTRQHRDRLKGDDILWLDITVALALYWLASTVHCSRHSCRSRPLNLNVDWKLYLALMNTHVLRKGNETLVSSFPFLWYDIGVARIFAAGCTLLWSQILTTFFNHQCTHYAKYPLNPLN